MPVHDRYARITPFELLMPWEGFAQEVFNKIREEAEGRGGSVDTPESFLMLGEAGAALRELRGEEDPPEVLHQHGALLFHAFHFFEAGHPLFLLGTDVVRSLVVEGPEEGEWDPILPGRAGYIQFPHHLIWTVGDGEEAPESLDGMFWAAPDGENVTLLIVMGIRKDRPGLGVVPLPTLPFSAAAPWASMRVRAEGEDFGSSMPGAELEGLYAVASGAEALKLAMRALWYLSTFPGRVKGEAPGGTRDQEAGEAAGEGPKPSTLPYRHVSAEEA